MCICHQAVLTDEEIRSKMLWGLTTTDNKVVITVFEGEKAASITLNEDFAQHFAGEIIRHARLLSQ